MVFLKPFEWIYRICLGLDRRMTSAEWLNYPTISVGNIAMGGRAKTPFVLFLAKLLEQKGCEVLVLTRGYGRKSSDPYFLTRDTLRPQVDASGDEALEIFLRSNAHVLVGSKRLGNFRNYDQKFPPKIGVRRVILLDDGFQHWAIHRDLDVVLVHRSDFSESVLPSGSLREVPEALRRAELVFEEGVDFTKRVSFQGAQPLDGEILGVLTTRAPASRSIERIQQEYQGRELFEMHLPDHASREEMLRALEDFSGHIVILGWKEAVKVCDLETLREGKWDQLKICGSKKNLRVVLANLELEFLRPQILSSLESRLDKILQLNSRNSETSK